MADDDSTSEPQDQGRREQRRHQRVRPQPLHCWLGEVVDVSTSGLRVCCKGALIVQIGDEFAAQLQQNQFDLHLKLKVCWIEKLGLRRHAIGLEFVELSASDQLKLETLVAAGHDECSGPQLWIAA